MTHTTHHCSLWLSMTHSDSLTHSDSSWLYLLTHTWLTLLVYIQPVLGSFQQVPTLLFVPVSVSVSVLTLCAYSLCLLLLLYTFNKYSLFHATINNSQGQVLLPAHNPKEMQTGICNPVSGRCTFITIQASSRFKYIKPGSYIKTKAWSLDKVNNVWTQAARGALK